MKNRFFFTAGIAGVLSGVAFGATKGANNGWFSEYRPYVAVRGGWLFGKAEPGLSLSVPPNTLNMNTKKSLKSAWAGSVEFGTSHFDDRVFCGVELGYFTGEFKLNEPLGDAGSKIGANGDIENFFAVGNIALRQDFGERTFWYGGVGGGFMRRCCKIKAKLSAPGAADAHPEPVMWRWGFLGQAFTGIGVYLTDDWQLTAGYRLRWMPDAFELKRDVAVGGAAVKTVLKVKQPVVHAVEVGIVRQF